MSNRDEEKDTLLETLSDSDVEEHQIQGVYTSSISKLRMYKTSKTVAFLTTTVSLIVALILLRKYYVLGDEYVRLNKQYIILKAQTTSFEEQLHMESSPYAGLSPEISSTYYEETGFNDAEHPDLADTLWDSIDFDAGIIALSDDYAKQQNLPIAQRFPWDLTKGIYLINGHHHLHCLKSIHNTISEYRRGLPQSRPAAHVSHCLDALRRQIICDADDTPRASTREFSPNTGVGQDRRCRSWEKLERWAADHTACYKYVDPTNTTMSNLERFKYCPEGSPYWDAVKKVYPDAGS